MLIQLNMAPLKQFYRTQQVELGLLNRQIEMGNGPFAADAFSYLQSPKVNFASRLYRGRCASYQIKKMKWHTITSITD